MRAKEKLRREWRQKQGYSWKNWRKWVAFKLRPARAAHAPGATGEKPPVEQITRVTVLVEREDESRSYIMSFVNGDWRYTNPPTMQTQGMRIAIERIADTLRYVNPMLEKREGK